MFSRGLVKKKINIYWDIILHTNCIHHNPSSSITTPTPCTTSPTLHLLLVFLHLHHPLHLNYIPTRVQ